MAEGLLRHYWGDRFDVYSAGTHPSIVRPEAIEAMSEIDIDIAAHRSKSVSEFADQKFDHVITVCSKANENCPTFPGTPERIAWDFEDPAAVEGDEDRRLRAFRRVRDEILTRFRLWLA